VSESIRFEVLRTYLVLDACQVAGRDVDGNIRPGDWFTSVEGADGGTRAVTMQAERRTPDGWYLRNLSGYVREGESLCGRVTRGVDDSV
jgi:hypothetical protein